MKYPSDLPKALKVGSFTSEPRPPSTPTYHPSKTLRLTKPLKKCNRPRLTTRGT